MLKLKYIKRLNKFLLESSWSDGFVSVVQLDKIRKGCPCADCEEDRKLLLTEQRESLYVKKGKYLLEKAETAGNYAFCFHWADGHNLGYYSIELLREIFEKHKLPEEEINRLMELGK